MSSDDYRYSENRYPPDLRSMDPEPGGMRPPRLMSQSVPRYTSSPERERNNTERAQRHAYEDQRRFNSTRHSASDHRNSLREEPPQSLLPASQSLPSRPQSLESIGPRPAPLQMYETRGSDVTPRDRDNVPRSFRTPAHTISMVMMARRSTPSSKESRKPAKPRQGDEDTRCTESDENEDADDQWEPDNYGLRSASISSTDSCYTRPPRHYDPQTVINNYSPFYPSKT